MAYKFVIITLSCVMVASVYGASVDMPISIPEGCKDETYCTEKPANYPEEMFHEYIKEKNLAISNRYGGGPSVRTYTNSGNCATRVTIFKPFVVRTNTTVKYVLQAQSFQQWIKQTECMSNGESCFQDIPRQPTLSMACTPTLGGIKLYLYDPIKDRYEREAVTLPVCCSCSVKSII